MNGFANKEIALSTEWPGIVIYSPGAVVCDEGDDYFTKEFNTPEKVAAHLQKGDIIGFNTGSSGDYRLKIREGYPSEELLKEYQVAIRLALKVDGGKVSVIDLLWLTEWSDEVPEEQAIGMPDGIYHVTVLTKKPESGIWGDNQEIYIFFKSVDAMPELKWTAVPCLF